MENRYTLKEDVAIIEILYKKKIVYITIDREDIELASSLQGRWIHITKQTDTNYFYFVCNQNKSISLHKLLINATEDDKVFFRDKDHTNLRKSNLLINTYEVDELYRKKKKEAYQNMSKEGRLNLLRGIQENRYSKDWSDKIAESKKGLKNPKKKLSPKLVKRIREEYSLEHITQKALAEYYAVGRTTIADIVNYRTWNEIGEDPRKEYRIYQENVLIPFNVKGILTQYNDFTNADIWREDFVLQLEGIGSDGYLFCQKIGEIKLYVEVRDKQKRFIHSFEVVFPEFVTPQHIHNYVITHRIPQRYMTRHDIHAYMKIVSTFLFGESSDQETPLTMKM